MKPHWQLVQLCRQVLGSAGRGQIQQVAAPRHFAWCWPRRALSAVYLSQEALRQLLLIDARHLSEGGECVGNMAPFGSGEGCFPAVSPRAPAVFGMLGAEGVVIERVEEKMLRRKMEYLRHSFDVRGPGIYNEPRHAQRKMECYKLVIGVINISLPLRWDDAKEGQGRLSPFVQTERAAATRLMNPGDMLHASYTGGGFLCDIVM